MKKTVLNLLPLFFVLCNCTNQNSTSSVSSENYDIAGKEIEVTKDNFLQYAVVKGYCEQDYDSKKYRLEAYCYTINDASFIESYEITYSLNVTIKYLEYNSVNPKECIFSLTNFKNKDFKECLPDNKKATILETKIDILEANGKLVWNEKYHTSSIDLNMSNYGNYLHFKYSSKHSSELIDNKYIHWYTVSVNWKEGTNLFALFGAKYTIVCQEKNSDGKFLEKEFVVDGYFLGGQELLYTFYNENAYYQPGFYLKSISGKALLNCTITAY